MPRPFKSVLLNNNIEPYKALMRSTMVSVCSIWEYTVDAHVLKLHGVFGTVFHVAGNFDRYILVRKIHVALKIPYL
jgi:hypothetical protein